MDGRPHFLLSVVDYPELWTESLRSRFCSSPLDVGVRPTIPGKEWEGEVESCAEFQPSQSKSRTNGKPRVAKSYGGSKKLEKRSDGKNPAFAEGIKCGGLQKATNAVNSLRQIRTKETPHSLQRPPIREEDSPEEAPALEYEIRQTEEDGTGIRGQKSHFQAILRAKKGEDRKSLDEPRTLDGRNGGNLDVVTCTDSLDTFENRAESGSELARQMLAALGPAGPGVLAVRNVPGVAGLRKRLLPLAKKLALMPAELRHLVLKKHGLNTDVPMKRPDRPVSAFATQLGYGQIDRSKTECPDRLDNTGRESRTSSSQGDKDEEELGGILRQLGSLMVEVGLLIARLCDEVCPGAELEDIILESGTAKGRLIHYHSRFENNFMSSRTRIGSLRKAPSKAPKPVQALSDNVSKSEGEEAASRSPGNFDEDKEKAESWQQWHFDYGLFTVLTSPLYLDWEPSAPQEGRDPRTSCFETSSWTHADGDHSGLMITYQGFTQSLTIPPDCLLVQVGEAAQIFSGGRLAATAHCVCRPSQADASRETFVVFLHPAWHRSLRPPPGCDVEKVLHPRDEEIAFKNIDGSNPSSLRETSCERSLHSEAERFGPHRGIIAPRDPEECRRRRPDEKWSMQRTELMQAVPPLASRWTNGCTFAEFSKLTTRQYYGADGRQSRK